MLKEGQIDHQQNEPAQVCEHCGSATREDVVDMVLHERKGLVLIEDVPARVCKKCAENFYDELTIWRIEKLRGFGFPIEKAERVIQVPVFSLSKVEFTAPAGPKEGQEEATKPD